MRDRPAMLNTFSKVKHNKIKWTKIIRVHMLCIAKMSCNIVLSKTYQIISKLKFRPNDVPVISPIELTIN